MDRYGPPSHMRAPVPPMRVSSLTSSRAMSTNGGRSSETSSLRSGRSAVSFESGTRTSQESTKPRLSKDQQEYLERRFQEQPKPNTQTKKIYANELGVPLEKINNWFQNRRAKSKQDAKKKQSAYVQFANPHHFVNGHPQLDQSYIDQSFYHTSHPHPQHLFTHGWQQPVLQGNSAEPVMNTNAAPFSFDLDPSNYIPTHGMPEHPMLHQESMINDDPTPKGFETFFGLSTPSRPEDSYAMSLYRGQFGQPENFGPTMDTIPEYEKYEIPDSTASSSHMQPVHGDDNLSRQNTMSSEDLSNSIPYPPGNGDLPMPPSADFFHPPETQTELPGLPTWGQSAGRPLDMADSSMQDISMSHGGDSQLPYRTVDQAYSYGSPTAFYQPDKSGATFSDRIHTRDMHDFDTVEEGAGMINHNLEDPSGTPNGLAQRRNSTMTKLVESIDNVHVQPHALEKKPSQQSIGHPSLGSRRQRRPAPLGLTSSRSTSFSSTNNPTSPKAVQPHGTERELRRIKSSIGVMNGRVHKSGLSGAPQRSPLSFTFSDAAASARASKSLSSRSMTSLTVDTVSRTNSLVPETPLSPPDGDIGHTSIGGFENMHRMFAHMPVSKDDPAWPTMPNTSETATDSVWSLGQNSDLWMDFHTPPETMQALPSDSTSRGQRNQNSVTSTSAQIEASWSHSLQPEGLGIGYHGEVSSAMPEFLPQGSEQIDEDHAPNHEIQYLHRGSQSLLDESTYPRSTKAASTPKRTFEDQDCQMHDQPAGSMQEQALHQSPTRNQTARSRSRSDAASVTPQPAHQTLQSPHRGDQSRQSGLGMFHVGDPDLKNLEPGQLPTNLIQPTTTPPRSAQQLVIQQFSPRDPVPTERMPPRARPLETPKNFEFQTCGPESFSSP